MNKFILACLLFCSALRADIIESYTSQDILAHVDDNCLILFDIDQTSLTPATALGSIAWFDHVVAKARAAGIKREQLIELAGKILINAEHMVVEDSTPFLIADLQKSRHLVLAFTARIKVAPWDSQYGKTTHRHLLSVGINFEKTHIPEALSAKMPTRYFESGILFSNWQPKGTVLGAILDELGWRPSKVIFIDDQLSYLESVEKELKARNIPFVGFHYRLHENKNGTFDPLIANIQLQELEKSNRIPSDKEASKLKADLLASNPDINPDFYLESYFVKIRENELQVR